jgi:hypothetical protein
MCAVKTHRLLTPVAKNGRTLVLLLHRSLSPEVLYRIGHARACNDELFGRQFFYAADMGGRSG